MTQRRGAALMPADLRELIRGTPFPDPALCTDPNDRIDYGAAANMWLERTATWRSMLAAMGQPYPVAGLEQLVDEWERQP